MTVNHLEKRVQTMSMYIKTSKGNVDLIFKEKSDVVKDNPIYRGIDGLEPANEKSRKIMDDLFRWHSMFLIDKWVFIDLDDDYYGQPEYPLRLYNIGS